MDKLKLAELLVTKFCHDIAGAIGAINNAVEFLKEDDKYMQSKAFNLLEDSSKQSVAKLLFFRQAYGFTSNIGEANLSNLRNITNNFLLGSKHILNWSDTNIYVQGAIISPAFAKLLLNIIYIAKQILIYGGNIEVMLNKTTDGKQCVVASSGNNFKIDKDLESLVMNPNANIEINNQNVHIFYIMELARSNNISIDIKQYEDRVDIILNQPNYLKADL